MKDIAVRLLAELGTAAEPKLARDAAERVGGALRKQRARYRARCARPERLYRVLAGGRGPVADAARAAWDALMAGPRRPRSLASFPRLPASVTTS